MKAWKRLNSWNCFVFLVYFAIFSGSRSGAQCLVNVDFGSGGRGAKTGFAATGLGTNDFWNALSLYEPKYTPGAPPVYSGRLANLKQADGTGTEASLELTNAPGVWGNATGDSMYDSYVFAPNGSNIVVTISKLEPGRYNFYLYGHADPDSSGEQNSIFRLRSAGTNYGPLTTVGSAGWKASMPWQEGRQYVFFRDVEARADSPVVIEVGPGQNGVAVLNGLQISSRGTGPPRLAERVAPRVAAGLTNLVIREIHYDGVLGENEARFMADLQIESFTTNEISAPLFEGDVAVLESSLPAGVRITRAGDQYRLMVGAPGIYHPKLEVVAKINRQEPWNQVDFQGPPAAIASIRAVAAGSNAELQLLGGTALENQKTASQVEGFLDSSRRVSLRWQSKAAEVTRANLVAADTAAAAQITPAVVKWTTTIRYEMLQGSASSLRVALPAGQALTRLQGEQIRDWETETVKGEPVLSIQFLKPVEKNYELILYTEQPLGSLPASARLAAPQPLGMEREIGTLTVSASDTVVDIGEVLGLRRVNATGDDLAAFLFSARPFSLATTVKPVEPIITDSDRVTARLEESRLVAMHALDLTVEKAGIYEINLTPQAGFAVTGVTGDGVSDWKISEGRLKVSFASRVLGARHLDVQLEQVQKSFPERFPLTPLRVAGASRETALIGAAAAPGLRVRTAEMAGLREIPAAQLPNHTDELLAFSGSQPDWSLALSTERLPARISADVFNLLTIGEGVVGGSATVRYQLVNQGVQEFHLQVPAHWRNLEFTGPNIRAREEQNGLWTIHLQEKAWNGYTLVVTYDYAFDPTNAALDAAGLHVPDAARETGSVAVTTAANIKLQPGPVNEPLRVIDPTELSESDRALVTRPVMLACRYNGHAYQLQLNASRQQEAAVLDAVADRIQLTSVLTDDGEMLTQASFMVKNNGKQFQRFQLPIGADFWGCYVDGQSSKAQKDGSALLVSLPQRADRDEAFAVDIVYTQGADAAQSRWIPRGVALQTPMTDLPNTFAEWELYVPRDRHVASFGGSMNVARGTTYGWRDAFQRFGEFYSTAWEEHGGALVMSFTIVLLAVLLAMRAGRRGMTAVWEVLGLMLILGILSSMLLPALARAKQKALRISSVNNLKQIGTAMRIYANDNGNRYPVQLWEQAHNELGNSQKLLIDPDSGEPYIYTGAGKTPDEPIAILAFSPVDNNGRNVLFGDGSVQQMSSEGFAEAGAREATQVSQQIADKPAQGAIQSFGGTMQSHSAPGTGGAGFYADQDSRQLMTLGDRGAVAAAPAAALLASRAVAAPAVAGLRSIHIDIPKLGQPFTFTKILNTGGQPLDITMSIMGAGVYAAARSAVQLAAFILGLIILFWQWHHTRDSLRMTVGMALSLGAVAAMLISYRILHLALIAGVPVVVLVIGVAVLRRVWPRNFTVARPAPAAGTPPAVAAIAFLLLAVRCVSAEPSVAPSWVVESAAYTGTITEHVAQFEGALAMASESTNQTVPLFGDDVALENFTVKSGEARLLRENGKLAVFLPNRGEAAVTVKFAVKLGGDVSHRQLSFGIPPALASRLNARIDEPDADVEFPSAVAFQRTSADRETCIEATIGPSDRVEIQWTPRVKRAAEVVATIFVDNKTLATFANGVMDLRSTLDFQISQGELRQARVRLPAGQRLLRVDGESIRTWQLQTEAGGDILVVDLLKGVSPEYKLSLETEQSLDAFPATVAVEVPRARDVKRETGSVAVRGGDELTLSVDHATSLERVEAADFPVPDKGPQLFSAWRFLNPGFALAIKVEAVSPQIEATVHNQVRVSPDQVTLSATIDYEIKQAGIFSLQVLLPGGYTVENVQGEHILPWQTRQAGANQILEVPFKDRMLGTYSLRVDLLRLLKDLPPTVSIPGAHPLNAAKLAGFISVRAEPGVAVKTSNFDGLSEIPAASLGADAGGGAGVLAYKFLSTQPEAAPDWKLEVACDKVDSWVRADIAQIVLVSDNLVSGTAVVRYDIQNAPVKEFRLRIPTDRTNIDISGENIRGRDQNGAEWHVELQNAVQGPFSLVVTWEKPGDVTATNLNFGGVQAVGVERESGYVVVVSKADLQVSEVSSSAELMRLDASELPDWIEGRERAALAYRYVRPGFKLSVQAKRFEDAAALQALAEEVHLTTVLADDGQAMTQLAVRVRDNGLQHLEVQLPPDAHVWSAFVGGAAVRPAQLGQTLLLPLEASAAGPDTPISVELTYIGREKFPRHRGEVNLTSPRLGVPLKNARWDVYLPTDYDYRDFGGSMSHETAAAQAVQSYSFLEYRAQEAAKKQSREDDAESFASQVRTKMARRDYSGINNADIQRNIGVANEQTRRQLQDLAKDLDANVINNLRPTTAGESDADALQQWTRLEQSQQLTAATVQPLRISLPTRGLRQSFTQVLQTEVSRPLTIQFRAASTQSGGLFGALAIAVLAMLVLWAAVSVYLNTRQKYPRAA